MHRGETTATVLVQLLEGRLAHCCYCGEHQGTVQQQKHPEYVTFKINYVTLRNTLHIFLDYCFNSHPAHPSA